MYTFPLLESCCGFEPSSFASESLVMTGAMLCSRALHHEKGAQSFGKMLHLTLPWQHCVDGQKHRDKRWAMCTCSLLNS